AITPKAADFLDIVLSKTRQDPYRMSSSWGMVRQSQLLHVRKVKFTQDAFDEKLGTILEEFPIIDDLHPFLSSLL
ncbi:hypothetical protein C8Q79DRAFT_872152, partial [Trametes meyenii]